MPAYAVVVAGLGPVGATLALLLGRAGIRTLVVEREPEIHPVSRAVALDDVALRVLQAVGLTSETGLSLIDDPVVRFSSADGQPMLDLPSQRSIHGHPAVAFFDQPQLERRLRAELEGDCAVDLLLGHELAGYRQDASGVSVDIRDRRGGGTLSIRSSWLVGCDGASSDVRRLSQIRMPGRTSRRRWLVVDVSRPAGQPLDLFEFVCDPRRPTVSAPLPGNRHRYEFMLLAGEDAEVMSRPENVRALLAQLTPSAIGELEILRASVYAIHARIANRWRCDRVFLSGDAAHLSPPFAGLGLSSGLRDVDNLAWKLATAASTSESEQLLHSYEFERRRDAINLIARAVVLGALIQTARREVARPRDVALRTVSRFAPLRRWAAEGRWKPTPAYRRGFVDARLPRRRRGSEVPQPTVQLQDTSQRRLDDVLGRRFALVGWRTDPTLHLETASSRILDSVGAQLIRVDPLHSSGDAACGVTAVEDPTGLLDEWFARAGAPLALVRPDRYAYAVFHPHETARVLRRFAARLEARMS